MHLDVSSLKYELFSQSAIYQRHCRACWLCLPGGSSLQRASWGESNADFLSPRNKLLISWWIMPWLLETFRHAPWVYQDNGNFLQSVGLCRCILQLPMLFSVLICLLNHTRSHTLDVPFVTLCCIPALCTHEVPDVFRMDHPTVDVCCGYVITRCW